MTDLTTFTGLLRLARQTVQEPRAGARIVLDLRLPREALWLMFALVVVVTVWIGTAVSLLSPPPPEGASISPIWLGVLQGLLLYMMVLAIHFIGRAMGGTGDFDGALILVTWLQFIFILVQLLQVVVLLILPPLSALVILVAMALFFWLLVNFIAELHGFQSLGRVFGMVILTAIGFAFLIASLGTILGLQPVPGAG